MQLKAIINDILSTVDRAIDNRAEYLRLIDKARAACAGLTQDDVRDALLPLIAAYRGVKIVEGRGKATGRKVFDREAPAFESAKRDLRMITQDICGAGSDHAAPSKPTKVRAKAAALALLEACGGDLKRAMAILKAVA